MEEFQIRSLSEKCDLKIVNEELKYRLYRNYNMCVVHNIGTLIYKGTSLSFLTGLVTLVLGIEGGGCKGKSGLRFYGGTNSLATPYRHREATGTECV